MTTPLITYNTFIPLTGRLKDFVFKMEYNDKLLKIVLILWLIEVSLSSDSAEEFIYILFTNVCGIEGSCTRQLLRSSVYISLSFSLSLSLSLSLSDEIA